MIFGEASGKRKRNHRRAKKLKSGNADQKISKTEALNKNGSTRKARRFSAKTRNLTSGRINSGNWTGAWFLRSFVVNYKGSKSGKYYLNTNKR